MAVLGFAAAGWLPPHPEWSLPGFPTAAAAQHAFTTVLGFAPVVLLASVVAFLAGEFLNSFVLAKLKLATRGRWLWLRTIASTLLGQVADTGLFVGVLVLAGVFPAAAALATIVGEWLSKVLYEVLATPVTYQVVNFLKRVEHEDYYDWNTNFNPLALE
jgi:uncharacterized integral membrane protein (TIGR00697 family)